MSEIWNWRNGGKVRTGGNLSTWRKTSPRATLSTWSRMEFLVNKVVLGKVSFRGICFFFCQHHSSKALNSHLFYLLKKKFSRYRPGVAQMVGRSIALLFHDCGTRREWVVSSTPWPHFTPGKDPLPILQEAGWAPGPVWTGGKSRPHRDSIPDHPTRYQSLYRLRYPTHLFYLPSSPKHLTIESVIKQNISISHLPFTFVVKFPLVTYQNAGVVLPSGGKYRILNHDRCTVQYVNDGHYVRYGTKDRVCELLGVYKNEIRPTRNTRFSLFLFIDLINCTKYLAFCIICFVD